MKKILPLTLAIGTMLTAACGQSGNDARPTEPGQTPTLVHPRGDLSIPETTPTPVSTPTGPVYLEDFYPTAGTNQFHLGKCISFTVVANGVSFSEPATVSAGVLGDLPVVYVDSTHLRIGEDKTGGTCAYTPIWKSAGRQDVTITSGGNTWTITDGIEMLPPQIYSIGMTNSTPKYTRSLSLSDPGANTFETPYDVDIYKIDTTELYRVYPHMDFFDMSTKELVPRLEFWNAKWTNTFLGEGAFVSIFPQNSSTDYPDYFVIRDVEGKGGPGADYDLGVSADQLAWTEDGSGLAGAKPIRPGSYHIEDTLLTDAFDPHGSYGCADSVFGTPINAPGPDAAFTITVPAGKTLRAAAYDNHWSQAIYLLPSSTGEGSVDNCVKAAGFFGGGNTNLLRFTNDTAADEDFYLIFDTTAVKGTSDGAFLISVELGDR